VRRSCKVAAGPPHRLTGSPVDSVASRRFSQFAKDKLALLVDFVEKECIPAEEVFHAQISSDPVKRWKSIPPILEELKAKAKKLGLWNLFLSKAHYPECVLLSLWILAGSS
jgi:acyl-CoA dehydrogenase